MKKLVMLLASVSLTMTAPISVVACTHNNRSGIVKTDLKDLNLKTLLSMPVTNQQAAFDLFIKMNPEISDLSDNVQVIGFNAPDYNQEGSLEIQAKPSVKYSGTLKITIPKMIKTDIGRLINNRIIWGTKNMTQQQAFASFLAVNTSWTNLSDYVEVLDFNAPGYATFGSLTISAKPNTAYTGTIEVKINPLGQTSLNNLNLEATVAVDLQASETEVFQAFIGKNQAILGGNLTLDQVELTGFEAPQILANGKLSITAKPNTAYTGTIEVKIKYILTEANFLDIFTSLSNDNLLQFEIPAGSINELGDLAVVTKNKLNNEMKQFYEYDQNITGFRLASWAWNFPEGVKPSVEDLNTPGYTLHLPKFMAEIMMAHPNGSETRFTGYWNVYWTIVEK